MKAVAGNLLCHVQMMVPTDMPGMVTTVIEELVETRQAVRCLCRHRTDDHDEIRMSAYEEA